MLFAIKALLSQGPTKLLVPCVKILYPVGLLGS